MARFGVVSRESHGNKHWCRPRNYGFVGAQALAPIVAAELGAAALSMPLAFLEEGGRFTIVAVLSVVSGQNMFVAPDGRWLGSYVPAGFRVYPFRMLRQQGTDKLVLCADEESGLIVDAGPVGEKFFDDAGGISPALKPIFDLLIEVERSHWATNLAVAALAEAGVIRPWDIKVKSEQGQQAIRGLHRIDEGALRGLPNDVFLKLRDASALPVAYTQLLSGGQLRIFGHLAGLRQQLAPPPMPTMPESLDNLFERPGDTLRFD
jgi:hypothetical protein